MAERKILATIICLTTDGGVKNDNEENFKSFWGQVEDCDIAVISLKEVTTNNFEKKLEEVSVKFKKYDCLVLAVSAHGTEEETLDAADGSAILNLIWYYNKKKESCDISNVLSHFDDKSHKNKQKIFLIQMCRVRSSLDTVTRDGSDSLHLSETTPDFQHSQKGSDIHPSPSAPYLHDSSIPWPKTWKIDQPCIRNSVVLFSAPSGFKSYTTQYSEKSGGWIFVCMAELMEKIRGKSISILDLFLMVNREMSTMDTVDRKNVGLSSFNHMLTENIFIKMKN